MIAAATGCGLLVGEAWGLAADQLTVLPYGEAEVAFLDEVAETILPRTDTPGARDAQVGAFIARYSAACHPAHVALLKRGITDMDSRMRSRGAGFLAADMKARTALLVEIDREARAQAKEAGGGEPHYFTVMKQLTLLGFFTSEPGATRVARYRPVPGRYHGCIPYQGEGFWAW